jgi:hypothetical protein
MITDTTTSSAKDQSKTKPRITTIPSEVKYPEQTTDDDRSKTTFLSYILSFHRLPIDVISGHIFVASTTGHEV